MLIPRLLVFFVQICDDNIINAVLHGWAPTICIIGAFPIQKPGHIPGIGMIILPIHRGADDLFHLTWSGVFLPNLLGHLVS